MCPSVVEIRSVTSEIRRRKKEERKKKDETTAVKYKPLGISMPASVECRVFIRCRYLVMCQWKSIVGDNRSTDHFRSRIYSANDSEHQVCRDLQSYYM